MFSPSANACAVNANNACVADGDPTTPDRGTPTVNTYTADNLLASATTPVAADGSSRRRVTYSYDPGGRTIAQHTATVDAAGQVTAAGATQRMSYSTADRLLRETGRDGATITTRYDPAGNKIEVVDSSGPTITATYYLDGLPRTVSDGARPSLFSYDGAGNRTYRADATGTNPGANRYATSYTFSDAGLPDSATSTLTGSGSWQWEYDQAGRPERETAPNGQVTTRTWNPDGTLARHTLANATGNVADWAYTYDGLYRQATQAFTGASAIGGAAVTGTFAYAYDAAGRLASFNDGAATKTLTWDADGNRLTYGDQRFSYNADDSIETATDPDGTNPQTLAYAPFGGVTTDGCSTYGYDGFDRLKRVESTATCGDAPTVTYAYDGLDRQRSRAQDGTTDTYHFDGWAATATVEASGGTDTVEASGGTDTAYVLDPTGTKKAVVTQGLLGATQYLAHDGFGNITTATSAAALVECTARFDPYGTPLQPRGGDNPCSSGSTINSAFYRGGRRDETTGAYQLGTRTYDPKKGTFLTPDSYRTGPTTQNLSIGTDPLTRNTYTYVNGDPINLHDPDGHRARTHGPACMDAGNGEVRCPKTFTSNGVGSKTIVYKNGHTRPATTASIGGPKAPSLNCSPGRVQTSVTPTVRGAYQGHDPQACMANPGGFSISPRNILEAAGLAPVIGEWADGLLCSGSILTGNLKGAAIDCTAMLPFLGGALRFSDEIAQANKALPGPAAGTAIRQVGRHLESVDDVFTSPQLLVGRSPSEVRAILGETPGWVQGGMRHSTSAPGGGWTFRELNRTGTDFTDRYIQWHPGTPRHFNGDPYWKVSSGQGGTQWIPQ